MTFENFFSDFNFFKNICIKMNILAIVSTHCIRTLSRQQIGLAYNSDFFERLSNKFSLSSRSKQNIHLTGTKPIYSNFYDI